MEKSAVSHIWREERAVKSRHILYRMSRHILYTLASAGSEEKVKKSFSVCHLRGVLPQRSVTGKWTVFVSLRRVEEAEAGSAGEQPARNTRPDSSYRCVTTGTPLRVPVYFGGAGERHRVIDRHASENSCLRVGEPSVLPPWIAD